MPTRTALLLIALLLGCDPGLLSGPTSESELLPWPSVPDADVAGVDAGLTPSSNAPDAGPMSPDLTMADLSSGQDAGANKDIGANEDVGASEDAALPADAAIDSASTKPKGNGSGAVNPIDPNLPLIWQDELLGVTASNDRWSIGKAPDGKPALAIKITAGVAVEPRAHRVWIDDRAVKKVVAETDWWFDAGYQHPAIGQKLWGIFGGCGACGGRTCNRNHTSPDKANNEYEGGWSLRNLVGSNVAWLRGYVYSRNRHELGGKWAPDNGKLFGKVFGGTGGSYPKGQDGRWLKVSLVAQMNDPGKANGWMAIYLDRKLVRKKDGILWQEAPAKTMRLQYRISHMYGGTPEQAVPSKNQKEWARDAKVWASFY